MQGWFTHDNLQEAELKKMHMWALSICAAEDYIFMQKHQALGLRYRGVHWNVLKGSRSTNGNLQIPDRDLIGFLPLSYSGL